MGQEFARNVCDLLVLLMILYSVLVVGWLRGAKLHKINANAVVGEGLAMYVTDSPADLEELLVLLNCRLVLAQVIEENTGGVICTALVS